MCTLNVLHFTYLLHLSKAEIEQKGPRPLISMRPSLGVSLTGNHHAWTVFFFRLECQQFLVYWFFN